ADLVHASLDQNWDVAQALHDQYIDLFDIMFVDTNPIPVKAALAMMGRIEEVYRLPLCELSDADKETLRTVLVKYNLV
ncbi:MAG: dihydrodipicolinate synthase family protein, partial [Kiritimatiellaceae bacterium]|nr:dihydrodipicolinate synthase family protein [Kiritimatiellaceae bacterium]